MIPTPTLFSFISSAVLMDAYREELSGTDIAYRPDGQQLNSGRMKARSRVFQTSIYNLLLADDCAINTKTEAVMQKSIDLLILPLRQFRLAIDMGKPDTG
ncbi:hypothetical protein SprV_0401594300 [Sparganum proliferum]